MSSNISSNINPWTNQPIKEGDFTVETKKTMWFQSKIDECKEQGVDTKDMEILLDTAKKVNKDNYQKMIAEEEAERKRREKGDCKIS